MPRINDECESRLTNLIWLMMGMFLSSSVQLNLVARKVPIRAQKLSIVKRLARFLDNGAVQVRAWYEPTAMALLRAAGSAGQVRLIIDASKVSQDHRLLIVTVAYHRRSVPIAWTWVRSSRGHSTTAKQVKLLAYVQGLLPKDVKVSLVGDCEFDHPLLMENLRRWHWDYVLRQPGHHLILWRGENAWRRLDRFPLRPGMTIWIGHALLTKASPFPTHVVLYWQPGEKEPWFLATSLPCPQAAVKLHHLTMWIEEMFGDMKGHGFDLESSHLRHFLRLSRLTLAVSLLYVWLVALGEHLIVHHLTALVDRADRRDLSIFRLGWDFLERCLTLNDPIPDTFLPNFCLMSGG
jgi:hypothetical protein